MKEQITTRSDGKVAMELTVPRLESFREHSNNILGRFGSPPKNQSKRFCWVDDCIAFLHGSNPRPTTWRYRLTCCLSHENVSLQWLISPSATPLVTTKCGSSCQAQILCGAMMCRSEARRTQRGGTGATHADAHSHEAPAQQGGCHVPVAPKMRAHRKICLGFEFGSVQCYALEETIPEVESS